jgi:hypothetical protein
MMKIYQIQYRTFLSNWIDIIAFTNPEEAHKYTEQSILGLSAIWVGGRYRVIRRKVYDSLEEVRS